MTPVIAGLFAGGRATRLGGIAKGLLLTPDGPSVIERSRSILESFGIPVVLVGTNPAYGGLGIPALADDPPDIGPLGGLLALLRHAREGRALALACDMPFVSSALVGKLLASDVAPVVAPKRHGRWEPLCALYDAHLVLPIATARAASGHYALQGILDEAGAVALPTSDAEALDLHDWDTPEDVAAGQASAPRVGR